MYEKAKELVKPIFKRVNMWENLRALRKPRLATRNLSYRLTKSRDEPPIPPQHLMDLVIDPPEAAWYLRSGEMAFKAIKETLEKNDINIGNINNILEFGCGTGRIMWYWKEKYDKKIIGTDYNKELIEYCRKKGLRVNVNNLEPPAFLGENKFHLVYANSVFTHLGSDLQNKWMGEIKDKLKRGGYLYVTLHGESRKSMLNKKEKNEFDSGKLIVKNESRSGTNICAAFHPESYVKGEFSRGFNIIDHIPRGARHANQDIYLLEKR
jgi:SAM-dependent methyltransferase